MRLIWKGCAPTLMAILVIGTSACTDRRLFVQSCWERKRVDVGWRKKEEGFDWKAHRANNCSDDSDVPLWLLAAGGAVESPVRYELHKPAGPGPFSTGVIMHGCSGMYANGILRSQFSEWKTLLLNKGIAVMLLDSFTARGISTVCADEGNSLQLNEVTERSRDAYYALSVLANDPQINMAKVYLIGFSNGASSTLAAVAKTDNPSAADAGFKHHYLKAFAAYPGCGLRGHFGPYDSLTASSRYQPYLPLWIFTGGQDLTTPPTPRCDNLVTRSEALNPGVIVRTHYSNAAHSWDQSKDALSDDYAAKTDSRNKILAELN